MRVPGATFKDWAHINAYMWKLAANFEVRNFVRDRYTKSILNDVGERMVAYVREGMEEGLSPALKPSTLKWRSSHGEAMGGFGDSTPLLFSGRFYHAITYKVNDNGTVAVGVNDGAHRSVEYRSRYGGKTGTGIADMNDLAKWFELGTEGPRAMPARRPFGRAIEAHGAELAKEAGNKIVISLLTRDLM